jgi:hypothetical protein
MSKENNFEWNGAPVCEMFAYPVTLAAKLLGMGRTSLWKEIQLGKIRKTSKNTIPRSEIERYLAAELEPLPA